MSGWFSWKSATEQKSLLNRSATLGPVLQQKHHSDVRHVRELARDIGVTITLADISVNHRPGGSSTGVSDSKPKRMIVKLVRRDIKIELIRKKMMAIEKYRTCNSYMFIGMKIGVDLL